MTFACCPAQQTILRLLPLTMVCSLGFPGIGSAESTSPASPHPPDRQPAKALPGLPSAERGRIEESRLLLGVLQNLHESGWTPSSTQIYSAQQSTVVNRPEAAANLGNDTVSGAGVAQSDLSYLPLERLGSEIDPQNIAILQEFGCTNVYTRYFQRGQRRIIMRIFQFAGTAGTAGAYGAYSLLRHGATTVIQRGDGSSEDDQSISFWQGQTFVSVFGTSQDDEESKNAVRDLADHLAAVLREHAPLPEWIEHLPLMEKVKASERVVMGPQSARRFFPAPNISSLDFSRPEGLPLPIMLCNHHRIVLGLCVLSMCHRKRLFMLTVDTRPL